MKKIFTFMMLAMAAMSSYAQYNLFDPADCDSEGWLWFDTAEKIAKYVGNATDKQDANGFDWQNKTVNPNGKVIQLSFANITPDYPESFANEAIEGTDAAGYVAGQENYVEGQAKTGAIYLTGASSMMQMDGGCLILNLPSCSTISMYMSSENSYMGRTLMPTPGYNMFEDDSEGENKWTGHTKLVFNGVNFIPSRMLHGSAGQWEWTGIETMNNSNNEGLTFVSENPVYFVFQNCRNMPIFIHGIKVTTPKQESAGISEVKHFGKLSSAIYNLAGQRITTPARGLYIMGGKKYFKK